MLADYEAFLASKVRIDPPTGIPDPPALPDFLKDFQAHVVRWALRRGRAALFEDTGMGKSIQEIVWSRVAAERTIKPALILTPLAVAAQFVEEGQKWGERVYHAHGQADVCPENGVVYVTNYERLHHFDPETLGALTVDESSILAGFDGVTRKAINDFAAGIPFRLAASATPAPNDLIEIVNHAEYLGVMGGKEIKALFFTQDGNSTTEWRLKGHARRDFWRWMASWAVALRKPSDLGFSDDGYNLPPLHIHQHVVPSSAPLGELFVRHASTLTERRNARRDSLSARVELGASIVAREPAQPWSIWCGLNAESEALTASIPDAVEVKGSDTEQHKECTLLGFAHGTVHRVVTKPSIAGMGLNWQRCRRVLVVGLSDSFRELYQLIRRHWRFGQPEEVHVHIVVSEAEGAVVGNVRRKEREHHAMMDQLVAAMRGFSEVGLHRRDTMEYKESAEHGGGWSAYLGDSVRWVANRKAFPDNSVGLWVFSPPFPGMYAYTNSPADMGNVASVEEMVGQFRFLIPHLLRSTMPGRTCAIHLTQSPAFKGADGYVGMRDFRGKVIEAMQDAGWIYYGEVTIDKNPQVKAVRTKDASLQFKSLATDSSRMRMAMADYLLQFRKPGENPRPVRAGISQKYGNPDGWITSEEWIRWARPVWYAADWMPESAVDVMVHNDGTFSVAYGPNHGDGIRETDTLNVVQARDTDDERHLAPLQLGVVERAVKLWSAPGEIVASPFGGVGTEGYKALQLGRVAKIVELKESYWQSALRNLRSAVAQSSASAHTADLFR